MISFPLPLPKNTNIDKYRTEHGFEEGGISSPNPLYIVGTSIERLREQREQKRTLYDWFQEETVRILRPDAPDEIE